MAVAVAAMPVCRFAGLLAGSEEELAAARGELEQWYGKIDDVSEVIPFTFTRYYEDEMGAGLLRQWVRFAGLFGSEQLVKCKLETNRLEVQLAKEFREKNGGVGVSRPINIDPGYVHRYKVVLATTKDHSHRVYMDEGIYAEVTLHWSQNVWTPWPWTYADHRTKEAGEFFTRARTAYLEQLQTIVRGR